MVDYRKMYTKPRVLSIIFLAATIVSSASLVQPTLNYMEFYTAMDNLSFRVSTIKLSSFPEQGEVTITVSFITANPTSYEGLNVMSLTLLLYYKDGEHEVGIPGTHSTYTTSWWKLTTKTVSWSPPTPIKPYSEQEFSINLNLNINEQGSTAMRAIYFLTHNENIEWKLDLAVVLSSFISTSGIPVTTTLLYPIS